MSIPQSVYEYEDRINSINNKGLKKLSEMELKFNELKNSFFRLTQIYEEKTKNEYANIEKSSDNYMENEIKEMIKKERENNANIIDKTFEKYNDKKWDKFSDNLKEFNIYLSNLSSLSSTSIPSMSSRLLSLKTKRNAALNSLSRDSESAINNLTKEISNLRLDTLSGSWERSKAICDVLNRCLHGFKEEKKRARQSREKVVDAIMKGFGGKKD